MPSVEERIVVARRRASGAGRGLDIVVAAIVAD
jgi:hypothetical protein